jgi:hypothetical protein
MKVCCSHEAFILGFTDEILNEQLNIIIFKYSISDFVYKVKLKFLSRTINFKNPSTYFNFVCYSISKIVNNQDSKMCTSVRNALITSTLEFSFRW